MASVRVLLPLGWALAVIGYYGPWIAHDTAALTLGGVDMGEFVKFLPDVTSGSLVITRQFFYLPPLAVVLSMALLLGSQRLRYHWPVRLGLLALAVLVSLQLLPPAWSVGSLLTPEFRAQTISLGLCWVALAGFWLWGALAIRLTGLLSAGLALAGLVLPIWQFVLVKPAIDEVYSTGISAGWGFYLCQAGLAVIAGCGILLALHSRGD